jgi:hypothetical protein
MFFLHSGLYLNFYIQQGILLPRLLTLTPFLGVLALTMLTILMSTSLDQIRAYSYRLFFITHAVLGLLFPPVIFLHVAHARWYVVAALAAFITDIVSRRKAFFVSPSAITAVPGTNLLKIEVPIPEASRGRFRNADGKHMFLSWPDDLRPSFAQKGRKKGMFGALFNPFTIPHVAPDASSLTLVLRTLNGPSTLALKEFAEKPEQDGKTRLQIDGVYGRPFASEIENYDRILLVAGGIGATFILPIYKKVAAKWAAPSVFKGKVKRAEGLQLVWAVRSVAETAWAKDLGLLEQDDEDAKVFVTNSGESRDPVEPEEPAGEYVNGNAKVGDLVARVTYERPNLAKVVDEVFSHSATERVAIVVCGPALMGREVREAAETYVMKGREVFFHDERFEW